MGTNLRVPKRSLTQKCSWAVVGVIALAALLIVWGVRRYPRTVAPSSSRVTASSPATQREIELAEELEKHGRVDEAEKAYVKALEGAVTPTDTEAAKRKLAELEKDRRTFLEKYLKPSWDDFLGALWKTIVGLLYAALAFGLLWAARAAMKCRKGYFRKTTVEIDEFIDGAGNGAGNSFREHVRRAMEQVHEYYKPRFLWHFDRSSFTVFVVPGGDDLFDIATEVVPDIGGKALVFLKKSFSAPRYKLSGIVHRSGGRCVFLLSLEDRGEIVKVWESESRSADAIRAQQALAYRAALRVKEYIDDRGNE